MVTEPQERRGCLFARGVDIKWVEQKEDRRQCRGVGTKGHVAVHALGTTENDDDDDEDDDDDKDENDDDDDEDDENDEDDKNDENDEDEEDETDENDEDNEADEDDYDDDDDKNDSRKGVFHARKSVSHNSFSCQGTEPHDG